MESFRRSQAIQLPLTYVCVLLTFLVLFLVVDGVKGICQTEIQVSEVSSQTVDKGDMIYFTGTVKNIGNETIYNWDFILKGYINKIVDGCYTENGKSIFEHRFPTNDYSQSGYSNFYHGSLEPNDTTNFSFGWQAGFLKDDIELLAGIFDVSISFGGYKNETDGFYYYIAETLSETRSFKIAVNEYIEETEGENEELSNMDLIVVCGVIPALFIGAIFGFYKAYTKNKETKFNPPSRFPPQSQQLQPQQPQPFQNTTQPSYLPPQNFQDQKASSEVLVPIKICPNCNGEIEITSENRPLVVTCPQCKGRYNLKR